jgi:hypothetical protein
MTNTNTTTDRNKGLNDWNSNPSKKIEEQRFEFIFYINDHIICQRYFNIRDYNEDSINSFELKELIDNIAGMNNDSFGSMGIIPSFLKARAVDYLWVNYNPYYIQPEEGVKNIFDKIDNFQFEIKVDKTSVAKTQFSGNFFPPKVRYDVHIKDIIPAIMAEIRHFLSQKNYSKVEVIPTL